MTDPMKRGNGAPVYYGRHVGKYFATSKDVTDARCSQVLPELDHSIQCGCRSYHPARTVWFPPSNTPPINYLDTCDWYDMGRLAYLTWEFDRVLTTLPARIWNPFYQEANYPNAFPLYVWNPFRFSHEREILLCCDILPLELVQKILWMRAIQHGFGGFLDW